MMRAARPFLDLLLPVGVIVILAILLLSSLLGLMQTERNMRIEASTNMLWVLSRAEVASLNLAQTLGQLDSGAAEQDDILFRHDMLLSRLSLIGAGPQRRRMAALGFEEGFDELYGQIREMGPPLPQAGNTDSVAAQALANEIAAFMGRAANSAMVAEWDKLGEQLDEYRDDIWQIVFLLVGIAVAGGALSAFLIHSLVLARRRNALLYRERDFSSLLIASSEDGILAVDPDMRCTLFNEAMERLVDCSAERASGRALSEISGFFATGEAEDALHKALGGSPASLTDLALFVPNAASPLYVDLRCFPLRNGDRIIGAIAFVSNVTERHRAQSELARHRDHLEDLVRERTEELNTALDRERAANEIYASFAAMVSHQFRTPLAIVDSALQRLIRRREHVTSGELVERAQKARAAIERLTRLVESTLDAARLEAGQIEMKNEACDLAALVEAVCERQREEEPGRKVVVAIDDSGPLAVTCDPAHAEHALANLTANAIKYSPPHTPINVSLVTTSTHARCLVESFGTPIAQEDRGKVFERYFRGANAQGKVGTGIGLYMARALARMQGGDIELVESSFDRTVFALNLPLSDTSALDELARTSRHPAWA